MWHRDRARMTCRRRADNVCLTLWGAAVGAVVVGGAVLGARVAARRSPIPEMRVVRLGPGGTVWGLARCYAAPGQDLRAVAREILNLNRLQPGAVLHPGTRLRVPDYSSGGLRLARNSQGWDGVVVTPSQRGGW